MIGKGGGGGGGGGHGGHGHGGHGHGHGGYGGYGYYGAVAPLYYVDPLEGPLYDPYLEQAVARAQAEAQVEDIAERVAKKLKKESSVGTGLDFLGGDVVGGYDMAKERKQMNALKDVPVCVARILVKRGLEAINGAIEESKGGVFKSTLPGGTTREILKGKLNWHEANIKKFTDSALDYPDKYELRELVLQAYIEWNAADEGRGYSNAINSWGQLWLDIQTEAAALPAKIKDAINTVASGVAGAVPWWLWAGGIATVGTVGFIAYKLAMASAPAVAKVAAERYLPGGRR